MISGSFSSLSHEKDAAMADDKGDQARKELDEAHEHADPSRGNKRVDGGDKANVSDGDEGTGVNTRDKNL
jgi:hypothetical protein